MFVFMSYDPGLTQDKKHLLIKCTLVYLSKVNII